MINTAKQQFVKGTEEYVMFNDFWKLCQSFWIPENTDEYREKLYRACQNFAQVHGAFLAPLAIGFYNSMERKLEEMKK